MKECESCLARATPPLRLKAPDRPTGKEAKVSLAGGSMRLEVADIGYSTSTIVLNREQATLLHDWIEAVMPALSVTLPEVAPECATECADGECYAPGTHQGCGGCCGCLGPCRLMYYRSSDELPLEAGE